MNLTNSYDSVLIMRVWLQNISLLFDLWWVYICYYLLLFLKGTDQYSLHMIVGINVFLLTGVCVPLIAAMVTLTKSICWRTVVKSKDVNRIGVVIYQKPTSNSCYFERKQNEPPLCPSREGSHSPWYILLMSHFLCFISHTVETYTICASPYITSACLGWLLHWCRHLSFVASASSSCYWCLSFVEVLLY